MRFVLYSVVLVVDVTVGLCSMRTCLGRKLYLPSVCFISICLLTLGVGFSTICFVIVGSSSFVPYLHRFTWMFIGFFSRLLHSFTFRFVSRVPPLSRMALFQVV